MFRVAAREMARWCLMSGFTKWGSSVSVKRQHVGRHNGHILTVYVGLGQRFAGRTPVKSTGSTWQGC
eukprot:3725432-Alexandrium_andersonii.AAC.1